MKIAVTYENGQIFQHFGHTSQFKVYEIEDGKILSAQIVDTLGNGHGALAGFLTSLGVNALICGGMGSGAKTALSQAGILIFGGVTGEADKAVADLIAGKLMFDPNVHCDHHGEHHHDGHDCGHHSCH